MGRGGGAAGLERAGKCLYALEALNKPHSSTWRLIVARIPTWVWQPAAAQPESTTARLTTRTLAPPWLGVAEVTLAPRVPSSLPHAGAYPQVLQALWDGPEGSGLGPRERLKKLFEVGRGVARAFQLD